VVAISGEMLRDEISTGGAGFDMSPGVGRCYERRRQSVIILNELRQTHFVGYNPTPMPSTERRGITRVTMKREKIEHFRELLMAQLKEHTEHIRADQAAALESSDDDVKDSVDRSLSDVNTEMAFRMGEQESKLVADIDQALLRIEEGTYGKCARCGREIDERRLEALPTARYDADCQTLIEEASGRDEPPSL
jgi:DnaK suppressor protein